MTNIIYLGGPCSKDLFSYLFQLSNKPMEQQVQKFHKLILEGLERNNCKIINIANSPLIISKKKQCYKIEQINFTTYYHLFYSKNRFLRYPINLYRQLRLIKSKGKDYNYILCDCLRLTSSITAILSKKFFKKKVIGILTDLPNDLYGKNVSIKQKIVKDINNYIIKCFDGYVFMTTFMNELINDSNKPYTILEGLVDIQEKNSTFTRKKSQAIEKKCLYTGAIHKKYGIDKLVDAFKLLPDSYQLNIYGNGDYKDELINNKTKNIHYKGVVENDIIVDLQKEADLLINPRPTSETFTKYSFPSKIMEYMVSGTATLTTKLAGIQKDYFPYLYFIDDESAHGISSKITEIFKNDDYIKKGELAREFVLTYKNNVIQTSKILEVFEKI